MKKHSKPTNRPLLLGELDETVQSYIKAVGSRGALVNSSLAITAGEALVQKYPDAVGNIDSSSWARSIFKRMGCVRRIKTSSKVKIPDGTRPEIEFRSWNSHHDRKAYSWLDDHKYWPDASKIRTYKQFHSSGKRGNVCHYGGWYKIHQYFTKHDKILSAFRLNGQWTCEMLFEKWVSILMQWILLSFV